MNKVKWGILGCGDVTEQKSGPAFNKVKNSELVAVMRRTTSKAKDYAERHGISKWYDQAGELIDDSEVNAIYIATPPDAHLEYVKKVAAAGKPVYVEKPMARTYAECQEMIEVCQKADVPLFVAYYRRSLPYFLKVKEMLENGAIGKPLLVNIQLYQPPRSEDLNMEELPWRVKPEISGGGYFMDMAAHQLDLLDFFFGPAVEVKGLVSNRRGLYKVEDTISASFKFESGIIANGSWCFVSDDLNKLDKMEIQGTKGRIVFSGFDFSPVLIETEDEKEEFDMPKPAHIQQPMIQSIVNELTGQGESPSKGESAARTNLMIDQITGK